jgi:hypothetical protein
MAVPSREQFWQTWSQQVLTPLVRQDLQQKYPSSAGSASRFVEYAAPYYLSGEIPSGGDIDTSRPLWGSLQKFEQDYLGLWREELQKEAEAQTNIQNIYSQVLAETQQQSAAIQKQTTAALNQQKVLAQQEKLAAAQSQAPSTTTVTQRRRPTVGQPGVARTRLTAGTTVGGFSGTSPGRVNPTGLNI